MAAGACAPGFFWCGVLPQCCCPGAPFVMRFCRGALAAAFCRGTLCRKLLKSARPPCPGSSTGPVPAAKSNAVIVTKITFLPHSCIVPGGSLLPFVAGGGLGPFVVFRAGCFVFFPASEFRPRFRRSILGVAFGTVCAGLSTPGIFSAGFRSGLFAQDRPDRIVRTVPSVPIARNGPFVQRLVPLRGGKPSEG